MKRVASCCGDDTPTVLVFFPETKRFLYIDTTGFPAGRKLCAYVFDNVVRSHFVLSFADLGDDQKEAWVHCFQGVDDRYLVFLPEADIKNLVAKHKSVHPAEDHVHQDILEELAAELTSPDWKRKAPERRKLPKVGKADSAMLQAAMHHIEAIEQFTLPFFVTAAEPEGTTLHLFDLVQEAFNRGINTRQNLAEIQRDLLLEVPPIEWQKSLLKYRLSLEPDVQDLLDDYQNSGYADMNEKLRLDPGSHASLNRVIEKAPPLPRDIIVYRFMFFDPEMTVEPGLGPLVLDGYLSTTFHATYAVKKASEHAFKRLFRIRIPEGTPCMLMIGGSSEHRYVKEHELLFSHPQVVNVTSATTARFLLSTVGKVVDLPLFEATLDKLAPRDVKRLRDANPLSRERIDPTAESTTPHFRAGYQAVKAWFERWYKGQGKFTFDIDGQELHARDLPKSKLECDLDTSDYYIYDDAKQGKPVSSVPELVMLMGAPGAGKSTSLEKVFPQISERKKSDFVTVDPDALRVRYSRAYRDLLSGTVAATYHPDMREHSGYMEGVDWLVMGYAPRSGPRRLAAYMGAIRDTDCLEVGRRFTRLRSFLRDILEARYNLVLDTTCSDFSSCQKVAEYALAQNYKVTFVVVTTQLPKMLARARVRAFTTGRWIDGDDLKEMHDNIEESLPELRAFVRGHPHVRAVMVENSGPAPKIVQKLGFEGED